jgi:hypothetical protein
MHIHLPKPLHGWREFVGEISVIVIGVLIALLAEEVVQSLHWRGEVRDFRAAVDHELALNLGTFRYSERQEPCIRKRLGELKTLLERSRHGETVRLAGPIGGPVQLSQYSSVWDNKDAAVVAHLSLGMRLKYAQLYDEFHNTNEIKRLQSQVWAQLIAFDEPGALTLEDRRKLHQLIVQARTFDTLMQGNYPIAVRLGAALGIHPEDTEDTPKLGPSLPICKPILPPSLPAKTS